MVVFGLLKNNMVKIIKLQGGLGNQMFQYAYGRALELAGQKVLFDTSFFNGGRAKIDTARDYKLDNFNIKTKAEFSNKKNTIRDLINKTLVKIKLRENGFYQNEKYFENIESEIRAEFTLKKPLDAKFANIIKQIENTPSVSIHVRRGDYVNDKKTRAIHNVCDTEYYSRATDIIKSKVNNPTFFVFSDDIDWVRENIPIDQPSYHVSNLEGEDYEELILMSKCKHNIIANSSFSWWGAWLNQNPNKIVIAPKQWFVNKKIKGLDIPRADWLKI